MDNSAKLPNKMCSTIGFFGQVWIPQKIQVYVPNCVSQLPHVFAALKNFAKKAAFPDIRALNGNYNILLSLALVK